MTIFSEPVSDIAGAGDNTTFVFYREEPISENDAGTGIVSSTRVHVRPVDGVLTTPDLEPGPAKVSWNGKKFDVVIPDSATPVRLWPEIVNYIAPPAPVVNAAVAAKIAAEEAADRAEAVEAVQNSAIAGVVATGPTKAALDATYAPVSLVDDVAGKADAAATATALSGKAPSTNIAKSALASAVQTSLGKADTASQPADVTAAVAPKVDASSLAVNVKRYGAVGDGATDDTAAVAAAHAAMSTLATTYGKATLFFPTGKYNLTAIPTMPSGTSIKGEGPSSSQIRQTGWADSNFIRWAGSLPATVVATTTANLTGGNGTVNVDSSAGLVVDKYYNLGSDHAFSSTDPTMYKGEMVSIKAINSGTQVLLWGGVRDSYSTSGSASFSAITQVFDVGLQDISIVNTQPGVYKTGVVQFYACNGVTVSNVHIDGCDLQGIQLASCINGKLTNLDIRNGKDDTANGWTGYGVIIGRTSENITVSNSTFSRLRHAVTSDSVAGARGIPRNVTVAGCTAMETTAAAFDTHPSAAGWVFSGCVATRCQSGFQIRGKDVLLSGCKALYCSDGILLTNDCDAAQVIGCVIRQMRTSSAGRGIRLQGSPDRVLIKDNVFENLLGYGITIESNAKRVRIIGNLFSHVGGDGTRTTAIWFNPSITSGVGHLVRGNTFLGNESVSSTTGAESGMFTVQMGNAVDLGGSGVSGSYVVNNFATGLSGSVVANLGTNYENGNVSTT